MTPEAIADGILLLGPGFLFWKTLYLSGAQHRRPEWEWIVWSVLTSLLIAAITSAIRSGGANLFSPGASIADSLEAVARFVLAIGGGYLAGMLWQRAKRSDDPRLVRFQRSIRDSAWDLVLETASRQAGQGPQFGVVLTVEAAAAPDQEAAYYGRLHVFGYEAADVEPWIYLTHVQKWDDAASIYRFLDPQRTAGVMFHQRDIKRIRLVFEADSAGAGGRHQPSAQP